MKWQGGRRSMNVQDRRGSGGMGRPMAFGGGILGLIGLVLTLLMGGDPTGGGSGQEPGPTDDSGYGGAGPGATASNPQQDEAKDFVSVILADTEDTWPALLQPLGVRYVPPQLVLFSDGVESACGFAQSAVGPFYCPGDRQVYLDLTFFDELGQRFGAEGDFAQAYVVAHEIGHHVQNVTGIFAQVDRAKRGGRLYLDEMQNARGKTMVAPYSLRAVDGAPFSAPLTWSEVNRKLDPQRFTLKTLQKRLDAVGDLFAPAMKGRQKLPSLQALGD